MKLDIYEKMEILQNCNLKSIESIDDSRLYNNLNADVIKNCEPVLINQNTKTVTKNAELKVVNKNNGCEESDSMEESNLTDLQPLIQPPLEPDKLPLVETVTLNGDFLSSDLQNMINIPENQIVKIEYQNENGVVNTQYIVNQELLNVELDMNTNYVDINHEINEGLYEEQVPYKILVDNPEMTQNDEEILGMTRDISDYDLQSGEICVGPHPGGVGDDSVYNANCSEAEMKTSMLSPQSEEESVTETDLTSLNWLHNITNIMSVPNLPTPPVSPKPKRKNQSNNNQEDLTININFYKKNGDKKPPFSYATLICMAMGKNGNKMTLSAIYHWIRENFLYYRKAHPSWQVNLIVIYVTNAQNFTLVHKNKTYLK